MQKEVFSSESVTGVYEIYEHIYEYAADKYFTEFTDYVYTTGQNEIKLCE